MSKEEEFTCEYCKKKLSNKNGLEKHCKLNKKCLQIQFTLGIPDEFERLTIENKLLKYQLKDKDTVIFTKNEEIHELKDKIEELQVTINYSKDEEDLLLHEPEYKEEVEKNEEYLNKAIRIAEIHYLISELFENTDLEQLKILKTIRNVEHIDKYISYLSLHKELMCLENTDG